MSIKVKAAIKRSEQVPAQGEAVYQLLKPVEASQHFFPRVHRVVRRCRETIATLRRQRIWLGLTDDPACILKDIV